MTLKNSNAAKTQDIALTKLQTVGYKALSVASKAANITLGAISVCDNYEIANQIARVTYGDNAFAVDTTLYSVSIGDDYIDGLFYRERELIETLQKKKKIIAFVK